MAQGDAQEARCYLGSLGTGEVVYNAKKEAGKMGTKLTAEEAWRAFWEKRMFPDEAFIAPGYELADEIATFAEEYAASMLTPAPLAPDLAEAVAGIGFVLNHRLKRYGEEMIVPVGRIHVERLLCHVHSGGLTDWQPIETAPKDGTAILGWCVHDADPYYENEGKSLLTPYGCHCEGLGHVSDGPHVVEWGDDYNDGNWESGYIIIPGWWFRSSSDYEVVANPTHWIPIPNRAAFPAAFEGGGE